MKILFVHDHAFIKEGNIVYTPGGFPQSVWELYLDDDLNDVTVFGRLSTSKKSSTVSSHPGVKFVFSRHYHTPAHYWLRTKQIKTELDSQILEADAVIIRLPSFLGLIACELCEERNKPYAVEVVGNAYEALYYYGNRFGKMLARHVDNKNRKVIKSAKFAIYVTKNYLQLWYPSDGYTEHASDVEIDDLDDSILAARLEKNRTITPERVIVCGSIGNVEVAYKGHDVMLRAIKYLKEHHGINVYLEIAGAGSKISLENKAKELGIERNLFSLGKLDRDDMRSFLQRIDVFVHPSKTEGLPRSVVEAMSFACPCLTSNVGGLPELTLPTLMHKPGDYVQLGLDLLKLINDVSFMNYVSTYNFEKSKEYRRGVLLKRRRDFWHSFYEAVKN